MPKRRNDSSNRFDADDRPIGLTGAFAPVKGPQSVDYDENDDPVGLTSAFGAIPDQDEPRSWDEDGKWKDFDWDAAFGEPVDDLPAREPDAAGAGDAPAAEEAEVADGAAGDDAEAGDDVAAGDEPDAPESEPERGGAGSSAAAEPSPGKSKGAKHGRHAAPEPELSPRMKRSKRTRRILIVLVILLVLVIGGLGYFAYRTFWSVQQEAAQQTQEQAATPRDGISSGAADDASQATGRLADVPNLAQLLGKGQDDAIATLGRGAVVTSNREVNEEGNPIKVELNVALVEEVADSKTGTPTVYLGIGEDGSVRQAGYSAAASSLGFGSLSFADAVSNEHVIEKTLLKAGIEVPEGAAALPANKDAYSTYGADGTTVIRERCSFEGDVTVQGYPCAWSSVLSYDYTTQVVTGNLADTVRVIYVYVTMK